MQDKTKRINKQFFDAVADTYDKVTLRVHQGLRGNICKTLDKIRRETDGRHLLDLCCGTGFFARCGQEYFRFTYGVDISLNMLKKARRHIKAICGDVDVLPFKDNLFDIVGCCGGLHHLYDFKAFFEEAYRVTKHNGFIYLEHEMDNVFMKRLALLIKIYRYFFGVGKRYLMNSKNNVNILQYKFAEYHNFVSDGVGIEKIKAYLHDAGFGEIKVKHHCMGINALTNSILSWLKIETMPRIISPFFAILAKKK